MKVLSIRQPWASLIMYGYKTIEFRTWKTSYRGKFLIHASKTIEKENLKSFSHLSIPFPTGVIMGEAYLDDCIKITEVFESQLIKQDPLVYGLSQGREGYGFVLNNIIRWDSFIEAKGKLSFWNYE